MTDNQIPGKKSAFDEIQALKVLYENIIKIIIISFVIGVLVAGYSLTMKNTYGSSAAIIIKAPEIPVAGEMPPLRVETLKLLVESPTIKMELFDDLITSGILKENANFSDFNESLRTWTGVEQGRDKVLLPIVKLIVSNIDQERAKDVANHWSSIVLKKTSNLYNSGVDVETNFTQEVFQKAQERLAESEDTYTTELLKTNLAVEKALLKANETAHASIFGEYLTLSAEAKTLAAQLTELTARLKEQEIDNVEGEEAYAGVWVGEIYDRGYRANRSEQSESVEIAPEFAKLVETIEVTTTTKRIKNTIQHMIQNERHLATFEKQSNLQYKKILLTTKEEELSLVGEDIAKTQNLLAKSDTQTTHLAIQLGKLKPTIPLNITFMKTRAIGWEIANPVYQSTQERVINLTSDIEGLKSRIAYFANQQETYQNEVSELASEIATEEAMRESLQKAIDKDKAMLAFMEEEYNKLRQGSETMRLQHLDTLAQAEAKNNEVASLAGAIEGLEKTIFVNDDKLAKLKREVDSLTKVHNTLAAKAEEVDLLSVTQKGISRSGAILLYEARANPDKVGPHRKKIVLIAMLIAMIASSLFFIASHLIRDN